MELNNNRQIKWETVITVPEFTNSLDFSTLKELSLLSKHFRLKLISNLFEIIQLDGEKIVLFLKSTKNNLICEYFNSRNYMLLYNENGERYEEFNAELYKDLDVESTVEEVGLKLVKFKYYIKSFELNALDRAGYYLFSVLNVFPNLTALKLEYCTVSLEKFSELLKNLTLLNCLEINYLSFAVLSNQEATLNNLIFPQKLQNLLIFGSKFIKITDNQTAFAVLFENLGDVYLAEVNLPPTHIQSLKNFDYYGFDRNDNGLSMFLEKNDQLEYLSLDSNFVDSRKLELISKSGKLKKLSIRCEDEGHNNLNFSALTSITKLLFYNVIQGYLHNLEIICFASTNLNNLNLIFDIAYEDVPQTITIIITRIIPKLNSLSSLNLCMCGDYSSAINLTELNNVRIVSIQASLNILYYLDFANNEKLNRVEFYWKDIGFDVEISLDELKIKFDTYKDWRFLYCEGLIKGRRIVNKN
jgi:hypothetical protein